MSNYYLLSIRWHSDMNIYATLYKWLGGCLAIRHSIQEIKPVDKACPLFMRENRRRSNVSNYNDLILILISNHSPRILLSRMRLCTPCIAHRTNLKLMYEVKERSDLQLWQPSMKKCRILIWYVNILLSSFCICWWQSILSQSAVRETWSRRRAMRKKSRLLFT